MTRPTRRALLGTGCTWALAGCLGPELRYEEPPPIPQAGDDADFGAETLRQVIDFALEAISSFESTATVLRSWQADPDAVDVDEFETVRSQATRLWDRYGREVGPHLDEIASLEPETPINGQSAGVNGQLLAEALADQERLMFDIEEVAITVLNADGDPTRMSESQHDTVHTLLARTERVIERSEDALEERA